MSTNHNRSPEELDAYLTAMQHGEHPEPPTGLSAEETNLADSLLRLAETTQPDLAFARALELRLRRASGGAATQPARASKWQALWQSLTGQTERRPSMSRIAAIVVVGILLLALIGITGAQLLNQFRPTQLAVIIPTTEATPIVQVSPEPSQAGQTPSIPPSAVPTVAPSDIVPSVTPFPVPSQLPVLPPFAQAMGFGFGGGGGQNGQPPAGLSFSLATELPTGPSEVTAYFRLPATPLTLEAARKIASQWGLDAAQLYTTLGVAGPPPDSNVPGFYYAIQGMEQLVVGAQLNYQNLAIHPTYEGHQYPQTGLPPSEQAIATVTQYLEARGQLGFPYTTGTRNYAYGIVDFYRLLDGWRLEEPAASAQVTTQGQVGAATIYPLDLQPIGTYPVLSAQEAWQLLATGSAAERVWSSIYPTGDLNPKFWGRDYPAGQIAQLFGAPLVLIPAEPGGNPRLTLNNLVLAGDLTSLTEYLQANMGFVHVWGEVQEADGMRSLQVAGWEPFDEFSGYFNGSVHRQADGDFMAMEDGRSLRLPDLPSDVADGEPLYANGGVVGDKLEWFVLQVHPVDEGQNPPDLSQAEAVVDQVELVYLNPTNSLPTDLSQDPAYQMLQPVWLFSGHIGEQLQFRVYVQAAR
jgi:hypothetical protein